MEFICRKLCRFYGKVKAVNQLDVTIHHGKVTALVGPNGAGKSTLLRLLAGREAPTGGEILANGESVVDFPERFRMSIGYMPDSLPEIRTIDVENYLDYFARCMGLKGEKRQKKLDEVIAFTGIGSLLERHLNELSKGLKQRVSLARVLMGSPQVLLLDEPAAGLDPRARIELRDDIRKLADAGCTIVVSSHILTELEDMCDEVVIMEAGKLVAAGKLSDLVLQRSREQNLSCTLDLPEVSDEMVARIKAFPMVTECRVTGRHAVEMTIDSMDKNRMDEALAALFLAHLPIVGVRNRTLEDVFMANTDGKIQ